MCFLLDAGVCELVYPRPHSLKGPLQIDHSQDPTDIAENYYFVHKQPRSTWTYEMQLRPWVEKF